MKAIPYVSFNGTCEEALRFYHQALGGEMEILRFRDIPGDSGMEVGSSWKDKVMHSSLKFSGGNYLYFGDTWEDSPLVIGTNTTVHLQVDTEEEARKIFEKLSQGGTITMPLDKTFWNSLYGSLVDKFGVPWGIEYEL